MSREETKIVSKICPLYKEYGGCEKCDSELDIEDEPCYYKCVANIIIENDYHKASEIAKDIIEVIENATEDFYPTEWHRGYNDALKDLARVFKKKYMTE